MVNICVWSYSYDLIIHEEVPEGGIVTKTTNDIHLYVHQQKCICIRYTNFNQNDVRGDRRGGGERRLYYKRLSISHCCEV